MNLFIMGGTFGYERIVNLFHGGSIWHMKIENRQFEVMHLMRERSIGSGT